jgi:hypothetical protein
VRGVVVAGGRYVGKLFFSPRFIFLFSPLSLLIFFPCWEFAFWKLFYPVDLRAAFVFI